MITVVIPAYNAADFLGPCVESCLQPEVDHIIVADDASPDNTWEIAKALAEKHHPKVTAIRLAENGGQYVACNTAFQYLGDTEFVGMQDADDVAAESRFKLSMSLFTEKPNLDIVSGRMESLNADGSKRAAHQGRGTSFENPDDPTLILARRYGHVLTNGVMTMRRKVVDALKGYEPGYGGSDTQFIIRAFYAGMKMFNSPKLFGYRRIHGNQATNKATVDPVRNAYRQKQVGEWLYWQQLQRKGRLKLHYLEMPPAVAPIAEEIIKGEAS